MVEAEKTKTLFTGSQFEDASFGHNRPANHTASTDSAAAPPGRFARFLSPFGHPRALPAVVVLTVLITLPTLLIGFFADDYYFLAQIEHNVPASAHRSPLDLYRFASHSSEIETWFADPGRKMDFFRPLTSLLFTLDHSLWATSRRATTSLLSCCTPRSYCVWAFFCASLSVCANQDRPQQRRRSQPCSSPSNQFTLTPPVGSRPAISWSPLSQRLSASQHMCDSCVKNGVPAHGLDRSASSRPCSAARPV